MKYFTKYLTTSNNRHFCFRLNKIDPIPQMVIRRTRYKIMRLGRMINETILDDSERSTIRNGEKDNVDISMDDEFICNSNSYITFASSDLHDGPRTDISFHLLNMNHSFVHLGPRNATKNYPQGKLFCDHVKNVVCNEWLDYTNRN